MGSWFSRESKEQRLVNKEINDVIAIERNQKPTVKLLLLGPGECGKSTVLKQMRIIHDQGFTEDEISYRKAVVHNNMLTSMVAILQAMENMGIFLEFVTNEKAARIILDAKDENGGRMDGLFLNEIFDALKRLWNDQGVQECYERRNEYQLTDSTKYFFDNLDRISRVDYRPTVQDILQTRIATMGISEVEFLIKTVKFRVFDVGGQKSERRKWIHCFDDVSAIIFIIAVSEYNQTLREDGATNRMHDALALFDQTINSVWFKKTSIILFLNKVDLFAEKIKLSPITSAFPGYSGSQTYSDSMEYIKLKLFKMNKNESQKIHAHETCATDTDQVKKVLTSVENFILQKNQRGVGFG